MAFRAEEITRYAFDSADNLLIDANVWLLVYGPHKPCDRRAAVYSSALADIIRAKSRIHIDVLILSEFINAHARFEWRLLPERSRPNFKSYRASAEFVPVAQDIADAAKRVLQHCVRVESGLERLAIDKLLDEYAGGNLDFNDQILAALCNENGWKLVTDDGDFSGLEVPVITANKRLLS